MYVIQPWKISKGVLKSLNNILIQDSKVTHSAELL